MTQLKGLTKMNDICLFVNDFQGSLKFFTEKFEFDVKRLQPNPETANYAEFEFQGASVTMWNREDVGALIGRQYIDGKGEGHPFMIAIKVDTVAEVNSIHERLIENGVTCIKDPEDYEFGSRAAYYLDFEENIWEVFAWIAEDDGPGIL